MTGQDRDVLNYIVVCISEFANRTAMSIKDTYCYLNQYKGLDFLQEFYDVEHILSFEAVADDLLKTCRSNGGMIATPKRAPTKASNEQQEMIEYTTQDIIDFLMEDNNLNMRDAMDKFYYSKTFDDLADIETGLYLQGSAYVYERLKSEEATI